MHGDVGEAGGHEGEVAALGHCLDSGQCRLLVRQPLLSPNQGAPVVPILHRAEKPRAVFAFAVQGWEPHDAAPAVRPVILVVVGVSVARLKVHVEVNIVFLRWYVFFRGVIMRHADPPRCEPVSAVRSL